MAAPVLVTGAAGFAGGHLIDLLIAEGSTVVGWHRPGGRAPEQAAPGLRSMPVDLLDRLAVRRALEHTAPACVYHCAGAAHLGSSWATGADTLAQNVLGTHHLLDAVRASGARDLRVLVPGSAAVYEPSDAPLRESDPVRPASPYALSKLAQEQLGLRAWADDGLAVLLTRSFNHIGPRQDAGYVASGVARQLAAIEAKRAPAIVEVGNLEPRRDVTDVRDTVRAYRAIMERGRPGVVYNVCSGRATPIKSLVRSIVERTGLRVEIRIDPARYRPSDTPTLVGDPSLIREELGWAAAIPLERTVADILDDWRRRIGTAGAAGRG